MYRLHALLNFRASLGALVVLAATQAYAVPKAAAQSGGLVSDGTCSTDMWDAITRANQGANWLLNDALGKFNTPEGLRLATIWFGSGMDSPDAAQQILFRLIDMRLFTNGTTEVSIHCEPPSETKCVPDAYGYHLPGEDNIIHLCPLYFTFDHNQGDYDHVNVSQVGGLLHELSHLDGTSDYGGAAYGYDGCRTLASSSTALAIGHADSWRYFLMQVE